MKADLHPYREAGRHADLPGDLDKWTWVDSMGLLGCLLMLWFGLGLWVVVALMFGDAL